MEGKIDLERRIVHNNCASNKRQQYNRYIDTKKSDQTVYLNKNLITQALEFISLARLPITIQKRL